MNLRAPRADDRAAGRRETERPVRDGSLSVMLVGAGRRGLSAHVPALAASSSLRLSAIVETPERSVALQADPGLAIPVYSDLSAGVSAARPDLAIVATPHDSHVELSKHLVAAGIPTLVEKPPARNGAELDELVRAIWAGNTPLATVLPFHYKPRYQHFTRLLQSPDLTNAAIRINADVPSWPGVDDWRLSREQAGGGVLLDLGYHYLEMLLASLGRPDKASARLTASTLAADAVEDDAEVALEYEARKLAVSLRVRSGARLSRQSTLRIIKNDKTLYSSCDPSLADARPVDNARTASPPRGATSAQIDFLMREGFPRGHSDWREGLTIQRAVLELMDRLYAHADNDTNLVKGDARYEPNWA